MTLPADLLRQVRRLDEAQLRRLLILAHSLLEDSGGPRLRLADVPGMPSVRLTQRSVRCGKRCGSCPHGPYWYARWTEGGRARVQYLGRELPSAIRRTVEENLVRPRGAASPG